MRRRRRSAALPGLVALGLIAGLTTTAPAAAAPAAVPQFADAAGIRVESANQVDDRLWALSVSTPALGRAVRLRVLLPTGYDQHPSTRYPVLYLFHGTSGGPDDWIDAGDLEATTANRPLIVVAPDAGFDDNGGGWFTDWYDRHTALGPSEWETFHVDQLVPWVDANFRSIAARSGRAVAGLSQGGFGAFSYAARHPDLFAAAASFSGAPDIASNPVVEAGATGVISATATFLDGVEPFAMFGPHLTNEINWQAHNPATLVDNLHDTALWLYTATGIAGELDTKPDPEASIVEAITHVSTLSFDQAADRAGVSYHLDDYVFGTHTFPYWARDLRGLIGPLLDAFAQLNQPQRITYRSADPTWEQWGWTVTDRPARAAFTELADADASGFRLTGFGAADVTTSAAYAPGTVHQVVVDGPGAAVAEAVTADASGRLTLHVPLATGLPLGPRTSTVTISG